MDPQIRTTQEKLWLEEFSVDQSIVTGLDEDIERIIFLAYEEFEQQQGPRFNHFIQVWQKTNLAQIFRGRESFREMFEFTEELLARVKKFAMTEMNKKSNHQLVRFAAIYMLYSLYFKQPCRPRAKIRLISSELDDLQITMDLAKKETHWDVVYAWCKLVTGHAFHFTACPGQMGLEVAQQLEQREAAERRTIGQREEYFASKEFKNLMKKLGKAHNKYTSMKNSLVSKSKPEDKGLFLVDENFPQTLTKLCTLEKGDKDGTSLPGRSAIGDRRRAIKDRAIGGIPNKTRKRPVESESEDEMWSYGSTSFSKTPKKAKATRGRGRGRGRGRERGKGKRKKQVGKIGDFFEGSEQF